MPLVLGAVFFVILYTFWLHDRVTAEALVREGVEQVRTLPGEEAEQRLAEGARQQLLWVPVQAASLRQDGETVQGSLQSREAAVGFGFRAAFQVEASRKNLDPPALLHLCCLLLE